jgi:hypothetical protein
MTTSRYSLGTTMVVSPEVLKLPTRSIMARERFAAAVLKRLIPAAADRC